MSETLPTTPPPDRSVKVPHLVFALLFLGLAGVWALVASSTVDASSLPLIGPGVLIAAGVIGLVASLASGRNRHRRQLPAREAHQPATAYHDDETTTYDDTTEEIR